jgi:hypothetical protein
LGTTLANVRRWLSIIMALGLLAPWSLGCTSRATSNGVPAPDRPPDGTTCGATVCAYNTQVCCLSLDGGAPECVVVPANCSPSDSVCLSAACPGNYVGCDGPEDCPGQGQWCCLYENQLGTVNHVACGVLNGQDGLQCGAPSNVPVCELTSDCQYIRTGSQCVSGTTVYGERDPVAGLVDVCN